jgi:hypothetical protein
MACGCIANGYLVGKDETMTPCCVIHDCDDVANEVPDLSERVATCYCGRERASSEAGMLAFFSHRPNAEKDSYYCGCRGWD